MILLLILLLLCTPASAQFIATSTASGIVTPELPFEFSILTLEADDSFTLPLYDGGTYNCTVDWGDESSSVITAFDDEDITHTYEDDGASTYDISISGTLIGWKFDNGGDKALMKEITQWGIFRPGNTGDSFKGCSNMTITATDIMNLLGVTDLNEMFELCSSITTIPNIDSWNVSNITTFYGMFHTCSLFNSDIGSWNTGSCQNTSYMFYKCAAFNQDIGSWDTADVTLMTYMFYQCDIFNQDISGWNTGKVSNMSSMFTQAYAFEQDIGSWDITSLTSASGMFTGVTLNTANYDALLIGWEAQTEQSGVSFHAGHSKYSVGAAATAKSVLETTSLWTITDGGQE